MSKNTKVKNEMAVAVAKDVLTHLDSYKKIRTGSYLQGESPVLLEDIKSEDDLQTYAKVVGETCSMCALGACMLSKARLFDEVPLRQIMLGNNRINATATDTKRQLSKIFSKLQMGMIESAFEMKDMYYDDEETPLINGAIVFGRAFQGEPVGRVEAIMENIIENGGEFVVEQVEDEYDENGVAFNDPEQGEIEDY